jgi:hypothetical protein
MEAPLEFTKGKRYRVRYRLGNSEIIRESIFVYLNADETVYVFSGRPVIADIQRMPKHWVINAEEVSADTPVYIHKAIRE